MAYIYKVTNQINNKVYIGKTSRDLETRQKEHYRKLKTEKYYFHNAILKYGKENFIWEILEECNLEDLPLKEQYWIAYYDSTDHNKGYNMTPGGEGYPLSQEIKDKISKINKGRKWTQEQKDNLSRVRKAMHFHHSEETRKLMSEQRKGRKLNLSPKEHLRRQQPKSEEFKQLMREKMTNRYISKETKQKMSESKKAEIELYCSNGMCFHSWEEVYNYLISNNLSTAKTIGVCRSTIYTTLNILDRNCYNLKWKTTPFTQEELLIKPKTLSQEIKNKISQANSNKNEIIRCYNAKENYIFNSRREAYNFFMDKQVITDNRPYAKFSSSIGQAAKKKNRHLNYYWEINQKDVETIEKNIKNSEQSKAEDELPPEAQNS